GERLAAWREAAGAAGNRARLGLEGDADVAAAMAALATGPDAPTAIMVLGSGLTAGAIRAAAAAPRPPHLLLFERLPLADLLPVPIWTVDHDPAELGRRGAELLLDRLDGNAGPARHVVLPTTVIAPD